MTVRPPSLERASLNPDEIECMSPLSYRRTTASPELGFQSGLVRASKFTVRVSAFATIAVAWHTDSVADRDCPICQVANLPVVKPAAIVQPAPPAFVERHVAPTVSLQELEAAITFSSPRAPPA